MIAMEICSAGKILRDKANAACKRWQDLAPKTKLPCTQVAENRDILLGKENLAEICHDNYLKTDHTRAWLMHSGRHKTRRFEVADPQQMTRRIQR